MHSYRQNCFDGKRQIFRCMLVIQSKVGLLLCSLTHAQNEAEAEYMYIAGCVFSLELAKRVRRRHAVVCVIFAHRGKFLLLLHSLREILMSKIDACISFYTQGYPRFFYRATRLLFIVKQPLTRDI